jgi:hypothetical protein
MITVYLADSFLSTPVGTIIIALITSAAVAMAGAVIKMMVDVATLRAIVVKISEDILEIKADKDTMKWSEYLRGVRNRRGGPPNRGDKS